MFFLGVEMKIGKLGVLLFAVIFWGIASNAHAILIQIAPNLTLNMSDPGVQQSDLGRCIIGDPSCPNVGGTITDPSGADDNFTLLPVTMGMTGSYLDVFSPVYTVQQVIDAVGSVFSIGIDIDVAPAAGPHELLTFVALIDGMQQFAFDGSGGGGTFGGTPLDPLNNNGLGFSDWQLDIFDISAFSPTSTVQFGLDLLNVSAGRDQLFVLQGDTVDVPEPTTMVLMGLGLVGLGLTRRKRKTS